MNNKVVSPIYTINMILFAISEIDILFEGQRAHLSALALPCAIIVGSIYIADAIWSKKSDI